MSSKPQSDLEEPLLSNITTDEDVVPLPLNVNVNITTGSENLNAGTSTTATVNVQAPVAQEVIRIPEASIQVVSMPSAPPGPTSSDDGDHGNVHTYQNGRWKDGICGCLRHGCCHSSLLCAWFFPLIAIAQVMRRMNLLINGKSGTNSQSRKTFWCIVLVSFAFAGALYAVDKMDNPEGHNSNKNTGGDDYVQEDMNMNIDGDADAQSPSLHSLTDNKAMIIPFAYFLCLLYLIVMTRRYIRRKYHMPQTACTGVADCCVAVYLPCCAISQMARHTTDYNLYRGAMCSETGLPSGVPSIV